MRKAIPHRGFRVPLVCLPLGSRPRIAMDLAHLCEDYSDRFLPLLGGQLPTYINGATRFFLFRPEVEVLTPPSPSPENSLLIPVSIRERKSRRIFRSA